MDRSIGYFACGAVFPFFSVAQAVFLVTVFSSLAKFIRQENEHKDELFGSGDRPLGWGSFAQRGGRKVLALPRKFVFLGSKRGIWMSREFCRDVPDPGGAQKVCAEKFVRILRSLKKGPF